LRGTYCVELGENNNQVFVEHGRGELVYPKRRKEKKIRCQTAGGEGHET